MRVAEPNTRSPVARIACRNAGGEVLRWATRKWKPQRAVFVADDNQAIWIVENPEAIRNFPAAHVVLEGKFDSAKKTLHVEKITPAAP